ncbi:MAG: hypothetical protein COA74_04330 [Gammaproteobacteria bacterium]|nr:MAG: hypothetical protein COA74_04330 [Gammaproteobacteria bacterium]
MKHSIYLLICVLGLAGCSGKFKTFIDDFSLAYDTPGDVNLSFEKVRQSKSDLLYIKLGERTVVALVLGYLENGQHKWLSADNKMLIMEKGRIIRTLGLPNNLLALSNLEADPLKQGSETINGKQWQRLIDWQTGQYGHQANSTFENSGLETLTYYGHELTTRHITEHVSYHNYSQFSQTQAISVNEYWIDLKTNQLIKSRQQLSPSSEVFEMVYISRIARSLDDTDEGV